MNKIFITVSTGNIGRFLTESLVNQGYSVKAGSRKGISSTTGAEAVRFDFADSTTYAPALEDVSAVFVMNPSGTQNEGEFTRPFLEEVAKHKNIKVVFLSGMRADVDNNSKRQTELLLMAGNNPFVILRPTWFMDNFVNFYGSSIKAGELRLSAGKGAISFIDSRDIADVALVALVNDKYNGQILELTGGESFTTAQVMATIAQATGRPVIYTPVSQEDFITDMMSVGMSDHYAQLIAESFIPVLKGELAPVLPTVKEVTGRNPRTLSDFINENKEKL